MYCRMDAGAPWGIAFRGSPHVKFGLVTRGSCWLEVAGEPKPLPLRGGDCYIVAANVGITVRDALRTRAVDGTTVLRNKIGTALRIGGNGPRTCVVTGLFEFDDSAPLFDLLPRALCVTADQARTSALGATLDLLAMETAEAAIGSPVVIGRLAEIMLVQVIRAHQASGRGREVGWLAALGNPPIAAALHAMHTSPARRWSVAALAQVAGMSRSAFALRFKAQVGETPLEYLTTWRIYKAACLLRDSALGIAEIAVMVGYSSSGAFHRVFQRRHTITPGAFRRAARRR